ncbi:MULTISPECIES: hypothetical protein [unclassified Microcoleus]|uniref:hypothetical protein n=1 Tax=unclassified Microcoleus TaxID=2642155 RepID=UPI002FD67303
MICVVEEGRRKKEEGRRKKEEGRRKREEGRGKREEGRRKKEMELKQWFQELRTSPGIGRGCYFFLLRSARVMKNSSNDIQKNGKMV